MKKTIAVIGTMDSKAEEHQFLSDSIHDLGYNSLLIDVGTLDNSKILVDITSEDLLSHSGYDIHSVQKMDRGRAVTLMGQVLPSFLNILLWDEKIHGVISIGGGGGTSIACAGMRELPIGFPKVMVTTMASGNTEKFVGTSDIVVIPTLVDAGGLNQISKKIFRLAAGAICGMVNQDRSDIPNPNRKKVVALSVFGNTTPCVDRLKNKLEEKGFETLGFHCIGSGGRTMEKLIRSELIDGVMDVTTTELADEIVGGVLSAGPNRLEAAMETEIPAVIVPGCMDMVNFHERRTVPKQYKGRTFYQHNPQVTLMRTSVEESKAIGKFLAEKINLYKSPVSVVLPIRGLSLLGVEGKEFFDPISDGALFDSLKSTLNESVPIFEMDVDINHPDFADKCLELFLEMMKDQKSK